MNCRLTKMLLVLFGVLTQVRGQLYIISGTPNAKGNSVYGMDLLKINAEGGVEPVVSLMPPGIGTEWIGVSYDWRKAVLLSKQPARVVVFDFDKTKVVKSCSIPVDHSMPTLYLISEWLADVPIEGPSFQQHLSSANIKTNVVQSMSLEPSSPCDKSFMNVDGNDMKNIVAQGSAGVPGFVSWDGAPLHLDDDGNMYGWVSRRVTLGRAIPAALRKGLQGASLRISNSQLLAVDVLDATGTTHVLVFRKRDGTWHSLPKLTESYPFLRGFDKFIAFTETNVKGTQHSESAGRAAWRTAEVGRGPAIAEEFDRTGSVFPGRLHFYDIDTQRVYTIATNQGDSEILLIEDGTVYYRASDCLYSAPIMDTVIGESKVLATDEAIRDAHWAFIKH
jgi:hypothetical protein